MSVPWPDAIGSFPTMSGPPLGPMPNSHVPNGASRLPWLAGELNALIARKLSLEATLVAALDSLGRAVGGQTCGIYRQLGERFELVHSSSGFAREDASAELVHALLSAVVGHERPVARPLPEKPSRCVIAVPLRAAGQPRLQLLAIVPVDAAEIAPQAMLVEYTASVCAQIFVWHHVDQLQWEAGTSSAIVELLEAVLRAPSFEAACGQVCADLKSLLGCDQVALGWCRKSGDGVRVRAISGMVMIDPHAPAMRMYADALDESIVRHEVTHWPPLTEEDRRAVLAHKKLASEQRWEAIWSVPLARLDGAAIGAILVQGRPDPSLLTRVPRVLSAITSPLAEALITRQRLEPGWWGRTFKVWREGTLSTRRMIAVASAAAILLPCVPWRYRVAAECALEPVGRRFCVAPYDGILQKTLVRAGDRVRQGELLAEMDDRELRFELSGLRAERARAAKLRDTARAEHETSEAQMAELEMERLDLRINLLKQRISQLQVLSPLDGIVLQGDLDDAKGAPVKTGQALFEIAPLDSFRLRLEIEESEIGWVREGMLVSSRLDGVGGRVVRAKVQRVHPQAELSDDANIFVVEADLMGNKEALRTGMRGKGRIHSDRRPLGWIWWHRAWHRLRLWFS